MVKVIGQDTSVFKRATCRNYGAVNEYTPSDVRNLHTGRDYSGGADGSDGFNCGSCGKEVVTKAW